MLKWSLRIASIALVLCLLALLATWLALRGSLPTLEGEVVLPGLAAETVVERDADGVVTITAASEADAMRALGYVHAQERYFEMDLLRRVSAGELSALFGPMAIERDRQNRVHRLRARLLEDLGPFLGDEEPVARAYQDGVNAGLAHLEVRPWPYLLLRARPEPWRLEDIGLAGYAMFFDLQGGRNTRELALIGLREHLPAPLYDLLAHDGTEWDAPLMGEPRGNPALPGPDEVDLRQLPAPEENGQLTYSEPAAPGSNNWAVAGALTADGRAILANDMHLGHRAPNLWFRVRLVYPDARAPGGRVDVSGVSLPGVPGIIVGSNGHVAWGFTNSYGDWLDWHRPSDSSEPGEITEFEERIEIKGGAPEMLVVRQHARGPLAEEGAAAGMALSWVAHQPGALNLRLLDMAHADGLDEALVLSSRGGIPAQNLLLADASGRIAWTVAGYLPQRQGEARPGERADPDGDAMDAAAACDPRRPSEAGNPCTLATPLPAHARPRIVDPEDHRLWTANARVADGEALAVIGDGGYALGARQKQIRDALFERERFTEADLLALQLDDRALFLQRWHALLQENAARQEDTALGELAAAARHWEGRASPEAVSYRLVRAWRMAVIDRIAKGLTAPARAALGDAFVMPDLPQLEGAAWELVTQRPEHLLPRRFESWDALFADAAASTVADLARRGPLSERTWGERNTARICHPLAAALPGLLRDNLCMPADPLHGDNHMPRVQGPSFGASQRMVVAPGREAEGHLHMPGGQSGHPLSPFWGSAHRDWVQGQASPFLPGATVHRLQLLPQEASIR